MKLVSRLVGLSLPLAAMLGGAPAAQAACVTSTPAGGVSADSLYDGGGAPEITTVQAGLDATCSLSVLPGLTDRLRSRDSVFVYIDRDGNAATGDPRFGGADIVVATAGGWYEEVVPHLATWNADIFTFTDPAPVDGARSDGGFSARVDRLGITSGAVIRVFVRTARDFAEDFAPEPITVPVSYTTAVPHTLPDVRPPAGCNVPYLTGRGAGDARRRLRDADCRVAARVRRVVSRRFAKGSVIRTNPLAGTHTTRKVTLVVSKGRRKRAG